MKNFNIMGFHWKIQIFRGGDHKKPIYSGELPEKGELGKFVDLRGAWQKREWWCF